MIDLLDLLWLRTGATILTLLLSVVIFVWSKRMPAFFIGLYALSETITRVGMQYYNWGRLLWCYEMVVTIASLSILIALIMLTSNIWGQKQG